MRRDDIEKGEASHACPSHRRCFAGKTAWRLAHFERDASTGAAARAVPCAVETSGIIAEFTNSAV
jgi:hypothetical protein